MALWILGGVTDRHEQTQYFSVGPAEDFPDLDFCSHGCGCECCQSHIVQCCDKQSSSNAGRFIHVVVVDLAAIIVESMHLLEQGDHSWGFCQLWFLRRASICRLQPLVGLVARHGTRVVDPGLAHATLVIDPLLLLDQSPDLCLQLKAANDNEEPRLVVSSTWARPCCFDASLDDSLEARR